MDIVYFATDTFSTALVTQCEWVDVCGCYGNDVQGSGHGLF
jgi:hypothetical protein